MLHVIYVCICIYVGFGDHLISSQISDFSVYLFVYCYYLYYFVKYPSYNVNVSSYYCCLYVTNHKLLDDTVRKRRLWRTTPRSDRARSAVYKGSIPDVACRSAAAADTRRPESTEQSERPTLWQSSLQMKKHTHTRQRARTQKRKQIISQVKTKQNKQKLITTINRKCAKKKNKTMPI